MLVLPADDNSPRAVVVLAYAGVSRLRVKNAGLAAADRGDRRVLLQYRRNGKYSS
jgi:hypothetical protein